MAPNAPRDHVIAGVGSDHERPERAGRVADEGARLSLGVRGSVGAGRAGVAERRRWAAGQERSQRCVREPPPHIPPRAWTPLGPTSGERRRRQGGRPGASMSPPGTRHGPDPSPHRAGPAQPRPAELALPHTVVVPRGVHAGTWSVFPMRHPEFLRRGPRPGVGFLRRSLQWDLVQATG